MRSLRARLGELGVWPEIMKVALTLEDIERYNLPPNFTKPTDSRAAKHIAKFGDVSVELDALSPPVLQARIVEAVEHSLDMAALRAVREQEGENYLWLREQVDAIKQQRRQP